MQQSDRVPFDFLLRKKIADSHYNENTLNTKLATSDRQHTGDKCLSETNSNGNQKRQIQNNSVTLLKKLYWDEAEGKIFYRFVSTKQSNNKVDLQKQRNKDKETFLLRHDELPHLTPCLQKSKSSTIPKENDNFITSAKCTKEREPSLTTATKAIPFNLKKCEASKKSDEKRFEVIKDTISEVTNKLNSTEKKSIQNKKPLTPMEKQILYAKKINQRRRSSKSKTNNVNISSKTGKQLVASPFRRRIARSDSTDSTVISPPCSPTYSTPTSTTTSSVSIHNVAEFRTSFFAGINSFFDGR